MTDNREDGSEWKVLDKAGGAHEPMMINLEGTRVLKQLEADRTREAFAYQELSKTALGAFLCPFYGVKRLNESEYMELGSAYAGMQGPTATMDIKIGKKTWEDDASPAKVAKESKKFDEVYSQSSAMDGFRVAGMKAGALVLNSGNLKARFSLRTEEFGYCQLFLLALQDLDRCLREMLDCPNRTTKTATLIGLRPWRCYKRSRPSVQQQSQVSTGLCELPAYCSPERCD